jgi:hypothetical protein
VCVCMRKRACERETEIERTSLKTSKLVQTPHVSASPIIYRVIQEELLPLTELISEDILNKKCYTNLGPILNIYRVTFVIGNALL